MSLYVYVLASLIHHHVVFFVSIHALHMLVVSLSVKFSNVMSLLATLFFLAPRVYFIVPTSPADEIATICGIH